MSRSRNAAGAAGERPGPGEAREWMGSYYDGLTAERRAVTITVDSALHIHMPEGDTLSWPIDGLRQTQGGLSTQEVRFEFGDEPRVLVVHDPAFADFLRATYPAVRRVVRRRWQATHVAAWSIGAVAAATLLYMWGAPLASTRIAESLPPSLEVAMGDEVAAGLTAADRVCGDSASLAALDVVLHRLLVPLGETPYRFRIVVLRDSVVNAFAAPGGFIAVNSGLLAATRTPEEFAGVLAHEIAHVTLRHSTRAIIREVPLRLAVSALLGESGANTLAGFASSMGALTYRRADEAEADSAGMALLLAARVNPSGMVSFMRTLNARDGETPAFVTYLSSHPQTADRLAKLDALARSARVAPIPLLDSTSWARVRRACGQ